jgi:beta-mannosidase
MRALSVVGCLLSVALTRAQESHIPLNDGWTFCQAGKEQWYTAEVPGVVQTDLLRHGLIPDFYKGSNIDSVQWIENEDWIYKRTIVANDSLLKHGHVDLVFKGLDTFAEVYLNDSLLGKADNMFRTWEWPIKELLRPGGNELKVIFRSPIKEGAILRDAYGIQLPHDNDPSGVSPYMRKAAYQFGWDFCPRLVTSGIWQGVELRCWSQVRITSVEVSVSGLAAAELVATVFLNTDGILSKRVRVRAFIDGQEEGRTLRVEATGSIRVEGIPRPVGGNWEPLGSGNREFHRIRLRVELGSTILSEWSALWAEKAIELAAYPDSTGRVFKFLVNGREVFIRGCNIVPPSVLPSAPDSCWLALVRSMRSANINMVRVWAGGIYPPEVFFDACDTAGIMVWQDFMFASISPFEGDFLQNSLEEVKEQFRRIGRHPSAVMWSGNNELRVAWQNWGWQTRYALHGQDSLRVADMSDRFFNEELYLAIHSYYNRVSYTPTSPLSNWGNAEGLKSGDLHYWGVWHGDSAFSSFKNNVGRFVSEYGFQSYPDSALLSHYIDPKELYLGSPAMKRMQRSYKTDKPIWDAIARELGKEPKTLGEFIEDSQEVQAKAYRMAIEAHMAAQPHCMGTLFWQLNDCWPGPSWSLIDYEGNWKPGMYEVQRLYRQKDD